MDYHNYCQNCKNILGKSSERWLCTFPNLKPHLSHKVTVLTALEALTHLLSHDPAATSAGANISPINVSP